VVAIESAQLLLELVAVLCGLEAGDPLLRGGEGDAVAALAGFQAERDRDAWRLQLAASSGSIRS
jgi:hypothetical protein